MKNLNIQALRAAAALMVVADHSILRIAKSDPKLEFVEGYAGDLGLVGVQIFFAISGFLMVSISWNKFATPGAAGYFAVNRIKRIWPLYAIATGLAWLVFSRLEGVRYDWLDALTSLLFVPHDARGVGLMTPVLGVGWTLNYEMAFYAVFCLCLFLPRVFGLVIVLAVIVLVVAAGFIFDFPKASALGFYTDQIQLLFASGMGLAIVHRIWPQIFERAGGLFTLAAVGACLLWIVVINTILPGQYPGWRTVMGMGLSVVCVALAAMHAPSGKAVWLQITAARVGDASYSIYLFHSIALTAILFVWPAGALPALAQIPLLFCLAGAAGYLAFLLVERPLTGQRS